MAEPSSFRGDVAQNRRMIDTNYPKLYKNSRGFSGSKMAGDEKKALSARASRPEGAPLSSPIPHPPSAPVHGGWGRCTRSHNPLGGVPPCLRLHKPHPTILPASSRRDGSPPEKVTGCNFFQKTNPPVALEPTSREMMTLGQTKMGAWEPGMQLARETETPIRCPSPSPPLEKARLPPCRPRDRPKRFHHHHFSRPRPMRGTPLKRPATKVGLHRHLSGRLADKRSNGKL